MKFITSILALSLLIILFACSESNTKNNTKLSLSPTATPRIWNPNPPSIKTAIPIKPESSKTVSQKELTGPPTSFFIGSFEAVSYIGTSQTVCGDVIDTNYASTSSGSPTFLNFDQPYPNNSFVVVIWGKSRQQFPSNPEIHYLNKQVCATGKIETYRGTPEMTVNNASQLSILGPTRYRFDEQGEVIWIR